MPTVKISDSPIRTYNLTELTDECIDKIADAVLKKLRAEQTEPNSSEKPNNCEDDDIFEYCPRCGMRMLSKWYEPKDEPQLTPNYCGTCKHREVPCGDLPCDVCHGYSNYEPKDEPTGYNLTPVEDEPQTDCAWK